MNVLVGQKIKELRKKKGLSQEEVAEYIHAAQSTYARIENGIGNSWANYIMPLCQLFEIEPEYLLKSDQIVIHNNNHSTGIFKGAYIINELSDKLIEQLEKRIEEKDNYIAELKEKIALLEKGR
ncbi:MAG: helix-turn-helix transcriptional regulator [Capnocytophaga sp.]|nr:helix-turn-helix transcriptional regulator [Capnocytophaga sp.]